jgi:hypothetical protein
MYNKKEIKMADIENRVNPHLKIAKRYQVRKSYWYEEVLFFFLLGGIGYLILALLKGLKK